MFSYEFFFIEIKNNLFYLIKFKLKIEKMFIEINLKQIFFENIH